MPKITRVAITATLLSIKPPACQLALLVAAYHLTKAIIGPDVAVFATVVNPTLDRSARPMPVTSVQLAIERGREAVAGADVVRAEGSNSGYLRRCQRHADILLNPRNCCFLLNLVHLAAFLRGKVHAFCNWLAVNTRGAAADCPDAFAVCIGHQPITFFFVKKLAEDRGGASTRDDESDNSLTELAFHSR